MIRALSMVFLSALLGACATSGVPVQTARHVDLQRYMGDWFVIANIPYFAEKHCVDSIESYALRSDGRIDNWFQCREKSFDAPLKKKASAIATVKDNSNAVWSVRFLKVLPAKYLILDVDPNYQWAAVGHPSRKYGWIFARGKSLPDKTYDAILRKFASQGYDTTKFVKVPQQASRSPAVAN